MVGRVFLNKYATVRLLGEGGMGRVYLAKQLDLDRQVVIKVMHDHIAADPEFRDRFLRETKVMARFEHPYAVRLYDASLNDPNGPFIIMEYIRGVTLDAMLQRNGRFSPARVGRLLGQLCDVLQAAHEQGIIHRDLKPPNLMVVDADTPYEKIKVMDFGLARPIDSHALAVTKPNMEFAVGTPGYICPEQVRGEKLDHRSDLYSVGVILYELLTGHLPFAGRSTMDILLAHATEEPPNFSDRNAAEWVPPAIQEVVMACLAKNAIDRPQSARELAERYETALAMGHAPLVKSAAPAGDAMLGPTRPERGTAVAATPVVDPNAVVHHLEAWMPEKIAVLKLRGFFQDFGGEVVQSVPGTIRVRFGNPKGPLAWLGMGTGNAIDLELRLEKLDPTRESLLHVTTIFRRLGRGRKIDDPIWRERCDRVYVELRSYLIGQT